MPQTPAGQHVVHFFREKSDLSATVTRFILDGLERGEHPIILATASHARGIRDALVAAGHQDAIGGAVFVDAEELLREVTHDGAVELHAFEKAIDRIVSAVTAPVRIFGDVASLLAARGEIDAAVALEQVGHSLASATGTPILCAYDLGHLDAGRGDVERIVAAHHHEISEIPNRHDRGTTVLLADDYDDTRDLYTECLTASGYKVLSATSGREAIRVAQTSLPDIILMDIRMPDISGVEAMQTLRQDDRFKTVLIVAFTANARERARAEYIAAGFDAVIIKPCLPDDLVLHVDRFCSSGSSSAAAPRGA